MSGSEGSDVAIQGAPFHGPGSRDLSDSISEDSEESLSEDRRSGESEDENYEPEVCPLDCPLRKTYERAPDVSLPPPPESLPLSRLEAYQLVHGQIKDWQTRLLVLEPGLFGSDLIGRLTVVDTVHLSGAVLHDEQKRVEYTCLSYTWGAQVFPQAIKLNDVDVPITENLFAFLQRFRGRSEACLIWIDALCINQFDLDEKATHVSNMLAVYEKAKSVVVWLGEEGLHTKLAMEYL